MLAQLSATRGAVPINVDQWDGYAAARSRLFQHIRDTNIDNVVVLTGDIHSSWANDLTPNPYDGAAYDPATGQGSLGVEIVCPGVTSPGIEDPATAQQNAIQLRAVSPHMKYIEMNKRGFVIVDINRERMQADWYHLPTVREQTNELIFAAALTSVSGANHFTPVGAPISPRDSIPDAAP
jgi:alkaline phosphatase D